MEGYIGLSGDGGSQVRGCDANDIDELAAFIVKEWKEESPLSSLETALYLLHQACDLGLKANQYREDSLNNLALSLVAKFVWTDQASALDEAIRLLEGAPPVKQTSEEPDGDTADKKDVQVR